MLIERNKIPLLVINVFILILFAVIFSFRQNYEFLMYIGVIVFFLVLIIITNERVRYPLSILWGLTAWSTLHMVGGGILIGGEKVYVKMLLPLIGEPYNILKYDQFVHIVGFGVATVLMYHLIMPLLKTGAIRRVPLMVVVIMAGLGAGAINEIVEFMVTVFVPETGVGGYINTSLDLVADLVGAILAYIYLIYTNKKLPAVSVLEQVGDKKQYE